MAIGWEGSDRKGQANDFTTSIPVQLMSVMLMNRGIRRGLTRGGMTLRSAALLVGGSVENASYLVVSVCPEGPVSFFPKSRRTTTTSNESIAACRIC